jgi:cell division protein ZapA
MSNVVVTIAGRPYTMQCPDGEEDHLKELARLLDTEVSRIKSSVGSIGDIRLLVMSGLMVADRLSEAMKKVEQLEDQLLGLRESRDQVQTQLRSMEDVFSRKLDEATERLDKASQLLS